jgi:hypothetical protein
MKLKNPEISNPSTGVKKKEILLLLASYCYITTKSHKSPWGSNQRGQRHLTEAMTTSIAAFRARFLEATVVLKEIRTAPTMWS